MSVFGALNRFISRLDSDAPSESAGPGFRGSFGFQVLRNKNSEIPIEPWYDFIVGINGRQIVSNPSKELLCRSANICQDDPDSHLFATEVRNCAGSTATLTIWSAKVH